MLLCRWAEADALAGRADSAQARLDQAWDIAQALGLGETSEVGRARAYALQAVTAL